MMILIIIFQSMSEIICLHIGGCGTRIGMDLWNKLRQQHQLNDNNPRGCLNFFKQASDGSYLNRGFFIDTDPKPFKNFDPSKNHYMPDSVITHQSSCKNLFADGLYHQGAEIHDRILQKVRKQVELCDRLSGFILTSSICGGVGSGVGALVMRIMRENYPGNMVQCFQVLPDTRQNVNGLSIYNSILQNHHVIQYSDVVVPIQNKAVNRRLFRSGVLHTDINDINNTIADCILQYTAPYRFSGSLNTNQRKVATNLLLFPRIKYIAPTLNFPTQQDYLSSSFDPKNSLIMKVEGNEKRIFTMASNVRGDPFISEAEINQKLKDKFIQINNKFIEWIPHNLHVSITNEKNRSKRPSALSLMNSADSVEWLKKATQEFTRMFRRKGYLYHYTGLGMDEMQFTEAQSNSNDLLSEYIPWGTTSLMDDEEEFDQSIGE